MDDEPSKQGMFIVRTHVLWERMVRSNLMPVACTDGVIRFVDSEGRVPGWLEVDDRREIDAIQPGLWTVFAIGRAARGVDPVDMLTRRWTELGWTKDSIPGRGEPGRWEDAR